MYHSTTILISVMYFVALALAAGTTTDSISKLTGTGTLATGTTTGDLPKPTGTSTPSTPPLIMPKMAKVDVKDSMPRAKACTNDKQVCVTVTDLGDAIDVLAEAPADAKWFGVGFGKGMPQADILLGYVVNKKFIISDRKASKGRAPAPVDQQQDAIPIKGGKDVTPGKWISHFQRPKKTGDQNDADVDLSGPVDMIVAYNANQGVTVNGSGDEAELRASIQKHTYTGKLQLNLQDKAQIDAAKQTSDKPGNGATNLHIISFTAIIAAIIAIASVFT